jgi:hypothetical protein
VANKRPQTPEKKKLGRRMGETLRVAGETVADPAAVPGKAYGWFRRWLARIWKIRGGGLYATGYIVTFVYFEVTTIAGEISGSSGVGDFFTSQLAEFIFRFSVESIENMIKAFMWPAYVVRMSPLWGGIGLGVAFAVFSAFLQKPIERWLLGDEQEQPAEE